MSYENETIVKVGSLTYSNIDAKMAAGGIAQTLAGMALGGLVGGALVDGANRKFVENNTTAVCVLTNARFVFGKGKGFKKSAAGGALVLTPKDEVYFDIPFQFIKSITQGKAGLSPAVVFGMEGEEGAEIKFCGMKKATIDEWEAALHQATGK